MKYYIKFRTGTQSRPTFLVAFIWFKPHQFITTVYSNPCRTATTILCNMGALIERPDIHHIVFSILFYQVAGYEPLMDCCNKLFQRQTS